MITLPCLRYLKLLTLMTSAGIPCHNFDAPNILSSTKFFGILFEDESITDYNDFLGMVTKTNFVWTGIKINNCGNNIWKFIGYNSSSVGS